MYKKSSSKNEESYFYLITVFRATITPIYWFFLIIIHDLQ